MKYLDQSILDKAKQIVKQYENKYGFVIIEDNVEDAEDDMVYDLKCFCRFNAGDCIYDEEYFAYINDSIYVLSREYGYNSK